MADHTDGWCTLSPNFSHLRAPEHSKQSSARPRTCSTIVSGRRVRERKEQKDIHGEP